MILIDQLWCKGRNLNIDKNILLWSKRPCQSMQHKIHYDASLDRLASDITNLPWNISAFGTSHCCQWRFWHQNMTCCIFSKTFHTFPLFFRSFFFDEAAIDSLVACLSQFDVEYELKESVKRGLAYYVEDGFEVEVSTLGAQKQIAGGGCYAEGIGWAVGLERLLLA